MMTRNGTFAILFAGALSSVPACGGDTEPVVLGATTPDTGLENVGPADSSARDAWPAGQLPGAGVGGGQASGGTADGAPAASNSGGDAQTPVPPATGPAMMPGQPDPTTTFDWPETQPDSGECQPGTYSGTFMCEFLLPGDPGPGPILVGPITLTLTKSQNGEFLEISDGQLDGLAEGIYNIHARINGKLDCSTSKLDAITVDGVYGFFDANLVPMGTVEGTVSGTLERESETLGGTWNIHWTRDGGDGGSCNGPFTATRMP